MSSGVDITVVLDEGNKTFRCEATMTVGRAEDKIRSTYGLQFGGITLGDFYQDSDKKFEDMKDGELRFVEGVRSGKFPASCLPSFSHRSL